MKYPKHEIYEELYKRYFLKGVEYLIKNANINSDDKIIDICGGNGRLTKELKKYSKYVYYLDQEKDMIPNDLNNVTIFNQSVQDFVNSTTETFDKVFCQQAINYWLLNTNIEKFSKIIKKDGLFIFNTFANKPSPKPIVKEYEIEGINYLEISYLKNNQVIHIQVRENYKPHITEFDWISKEQYLELLSPYFDIKNIKDNKSVVYVCKRK